MFPKRYRLPFTKPSSELGLSEEQIQVQILAFPDLKSPEHLARNPMGTSPTLTDKENDIAIWESGAVLKYILTTLDPDFRLHPNPQPCSKINLANFLHIQQFIITTVYPFLASLFIHTLQPAEKQNSKYIEIAKETFQTRLGPFLAKFLGKGPYFLGNKVSAIDYLVAKPLNNVHALGMLEQESPTLYKLFQRIRCRTSFEIAYQVDAIDACNCRNLRLVLDIPHSSIDDADKDIEKEIRSMMMH